ncbi:hypothetical protein E9232_001127 [Inquilinus ginsengisoli]|uniref:Uncharacterized protein n=1 Tax=Inquilinus ginsengisoli TaxID=363840 RepID=A0ABU1JJ30_9PROT|nr:hypothetical protein [Inquilinus ginsengisoli]MDR6288620.1 hypothetical protein [Inquilinus ginsengisoli]
MELLTATGVPLLLCDDGVIVPAALEPDDVPAAPIATTPIKE